MNTTDNSPIEDQESAVLVSVTELQRQLNDSLKQLSPERLQVLADFAAYLVNAKSEAATQELLAIPGLLERVKHSSATPKTDYANWRSLRSDV
jgi:predicted RecB family endonuclease